MLEGILEKVLLNYFGDIFENLDKNKLSVALWSGTVLLENISLSKKCFDKYTIPITLKYGKIKKINVIIDWKSNFTKPTIIEIEGVNIVLGVLNQTEWKETNEIYYPFKIVKLKSIVKDKIDLLSESSNKDSNGYIASLVIKIIDNIQLSLKNIHFRIEEVNTKTPYSMGFNLKELSVISTNDEWKQVLIERTLNQALFFKLLTLNDFGVYLNANEAQFTSNDFNPNAFNLTYLIIPMSLKAKMTQNNTPKEGIEPSYKVDVSLNHFGIDISKLQYESVFSILNSVSSYRKFQSKIFNTRKFLYFKPKAKMMLREKNIKISPKEKKENTLEWFKFAIVAIRKQLQFMKGNGKEFDIEENVLNDFKTKFRDELKKVILDKKDSGDEQFKHIVQCVNIEVLITWLSPVIEEILKEKTLKEKEKQKGFFSSWFSSDNQSIVLSEEEKVAIFNISQELLANKAKENKKAFIFDFLISLQEGWIRLISSDEGSDSLKLKFTQMNVRQKNYCNRSMFSANLKTVDISYYQQLEQVNCPITNKDLSMSSVNGVTGEPIVNFAYTSYSEATEDYESEMYLKLLSQDIVYNPSLIKLLKDFFDIQIEENLKEEAYKDLSLLVDSSQQLINENFSTRHRIDIQILERSLYVPISKNDIFKSAFLVFNFGHLKLSTPLENYSDPNYELKYIFSFTSLALQYYSSYSNIIERKEGENIFNNLSGAIKISQSKDAPSKSASQHQRSNEMKAIRAVVELGAIDLSLTEYHYALLLSFGHIFTFGPEQDKSLLKEETKKSKEIGLIYVQSQGISGVWIPYWSVISRHHICFYTKKESPKPFSSFDLKGCVYTSIDDASNHLKLKSQFQIINIQFPSHKEMNSFKDEMTLINILDNQDESYQMIVKKHNMSSQRYFEGLINLQMISCTFSNSSHQSSQKYTIQIENNSISLSLSEQNIKMSFSIHHIKLLNRNSSHRSFAYIINTNANANHNEANDHFVVIDTTIDNSTSSMGINLKLGYLNIIYHPRTVNSIIALLSTKPFYAQDKVKAINEANTSGILSKEFNCLNSTEETNIKAEMKLINITFVQPNMNMFFFALKFEQTAMTMIMGYDHFNMQGSVGNLELFDLINYPFTIKTQDEYRESNKQVILGSKQDTQSLIDFDIQIFQPHCHLVKNKINGIIKSKVNSVFLNLSQELFLRLLNYILNEVLLSLVVNTMDKRVKEDNQIESIDKAYGNIVSLNVTLTNPQIIIKARPNSNNYFVVDFGTVKLTNGGYFIKNRILHLPNEERLIQVFQLEFNGAKIKANDGFSLSDSIKGLVNISSLTMKRQDFLLNKEQINSSIEIDMHLSEICLNLSQREFTELMRCVDLNFAYTDYLSEQFVFNEFSSTDEILFNSKLSQQKQKEKKTEVRLKGFFEKVNLKLMIEDRSFAELSLNNIHLSMITYDNKELIFSIILSDISLMEHLLTNGDQKVVPLLLNNLLISDKEIKDILNKSKELISLKQMLPLDKVNYPYQQLRLSFAMNSNQEKKIEIMLDDLIVLVKIDTLLLLNIFFAEGFPSYINEPKEDCPNSFDPNEDNYPKMIVELKTNKVSLCLLSDSFSNKTQDIIYLSSEFFLFFEKNKVADVKTHLRLGHNEKGNITKVNLKSKNISIVLYSLNELTYPPSKKKKERKVINQPTIDLIYVINLEMNDLNAFDLITKANFAFEEIELKLSYRDIITALRINEYKQSLLGEEFEKRKEALSKAKVLQTTFGTVSASTTSPCQETKREQIGQTDINLTGSKSIRVILINNDNETYYPFLTLLFNSFFLIHKSIGESYSSSIASFILQAYSFNYLASYWEPLIESFPFYSTLIFDATKSSETKYLIDLNSENKEISNFNVSDLSIEFTYRNLKSWIDNFLLLKSDYKTQISKVINSKFTQSISNHKVFNYSGRRMKLKSNKEEYVIEENKSLDLDFYPNEEESNTSRFTKKMKYQQIYSFTLENVNGKSNFIDIDSLNFKYHSFSTGLNNQYSFVASKVELNGLKKHVYFFAPLVLKNKTQSELQLVLSVKGKKDSNNLLKPSECFGVQSEYIEGDIRIVFQGSEDLKMKTAELLTEPGVFQEKKTKDKYYILSYSKSEDKFNRHRIIDIRHGFIIKNCLPLNLTLTIAAAVKKTFQIKKNERLVIDCASFYSVLKAGIELEKIAKQTEVVLFDPRSKEKRAILRLNSNEGSPIEITSTLYNEEEERVIILHSEQILVNLCGDNMQFFLGDKAGRLSPIPYQTNSINMFILNQSTNHLLIFEYKGVFSDLINLKALPSFLEVKCNERNSNYRISSSSKSKSSGKTVEYEFVLETKVSLIDIECNIYSTVLTLCPKYYIFNQSKINLILEFADSKEKILLNSSKKEIFDFFGLSPRNSKVIIHPQLKENNETKWRPCYPIILFSNNLQTLQFKPTIGYDKLYLNLEKCKETISTIFYLTEATEANSQLVLNNKTTQMNCLIYQKNYSNDSIELKANSTHCFSFTNHLDEHIICIHQPKWDFIRYIRLKEKSYLFYSDEDQGDKGEHMYFVNQLISLQGMSGLLKINVDSTGFQTVITLSEEMKSKSKAEKKEKPLVYEVAFRMNSLGLNIFGDNRNIGFKNTIRHYSRIDLLYLEMNRLDFYYKYDNETKENVVQFCLQDLQIGNETSSSNYYPILFAPLLEDGIFKSTNKAIERLPIINIIANYKVNQNNKMNVSELSFSFQAFKLKVESNLVLGFYNFIQNITLGTQSSVTSIHPIYCSEEENLKRKIFIQGPYVILLRNNEVVVRETNLIIDYLSIPSFKVQLSFLNQSNEFLQTILNTNVFFSSIFGTMSSIEDVPLNLNGCEIHRFTGNWGDLFDSISQHYKEHILRQAYKIFGGISILGSPNTFLSICSNGVNDLYKEPANGFKNGPLQGFVGIAKGSASLVQHTVEGTLNSTSQVTSGISKALLLVSQDDEYMKSREQSKIVDKPKNVLEGVGYGMKSFATGLFHGVTDIVVQPIKGAQEENLLGFGKGLLKGFGGILSKPVSGLFDLVSKTTEGIKNNVSSNINDVQLRFPRVFYGRYKLIKNYILSDSKIIALIRRSSDLYDKENLGLNSVFNLVLKKKKKECVMIFTSEGIIAFNLKKQRISNALFSKPILYYFEIETYEFIGSDCICFALANKKTIKIEIEDELTNASGLLRKLNKSVHNSKMN